MVVHTGTDCYTRAQAATKITPRNAQVSDSSGTQAKTRATLKMPNLTGPPPRNLSQSRTHAGTG